MHYTGTIWRPPYEACSALIQVTAGCTHHKCKFCTLYEDVPFKFRMSPLSEVEADLKECTGQQKLDTLIIFFYIQSAITVQTHMFPCTVLVLNIPVSMQAVLR